MTEAFDASPVAMGLVGLDGTWLRFNDRLCELLRIEREQLSVMTPRELIHPEDRPAAVLATARLLNGEVGTVDAVRRYLRADGRVLQARVTTSLLRDADGLPDSLFTQLVEVAGSRASLGSGRDPVTGCFGADAFLGHVRHALQRRRRSGRMVAVLTVDLPLLDTTTQAGNRALACLAQRVVGTVRGSDVVGRTAAGRLSVCCEDLRSDAEIDRVVTRLAEVLGTAIDVDGELTRVESHLSVAVAEDDESARELVARPGWPAPRAVLRQGRRARHDVASAL